MKMRYHEGIFYPENKDELSLLLGDGISEKEAKALTLPHAGLSHISSLLREGFSYTKNKERVIILSPLHSGRIYGEKGFFFEGELLPGSFMFHLGAEIKEMYAEEEPGPEELIPYVEKYMENKPWAILYCDIKTAQESKRLASFLSPYNTPSTLFIVSTNLSPKCSKKEECEMWRENAKIALKEGKEILDKANKHYISLCGSGILDALERIIPGGWTSVSDNRDETTAHSLLIKGGEL